MASMTSSKNFSSLLPHLIRSLVLLITFSALGLVSASAYTYPTVNGTNFLYGNTGTIAVGQSTYGAVPNKTGMPYRYFIPAGYTTATKYPVVIFLHGLGEAGTNNEDQLGSGANGAMSLISSASPNNQANYPCFWVAPQHQGDKVTTGYFGAVDMPDMLKIITTLTTFYNIDTSRIIVTGLSGGAIGVGGMLGDPVGSSTFSCGAPLSGSNLLISMPPKPLWVFHSADDPKVAVGLDDSGVRALREEGRTVIYTRFMSGGHTTTMWTACYQQPLLLPWMLAQKIGLPMQGVFNMLVSGASQGTSLNLSGTADSSVGYNRIGWTSSMNQTTSGNFSDETFSGTAMTTTTTNLAVGNRLQLITGNNPYYFDVVAATDSHHVTLSAAPITYHFANSWPFSICSTGMDLVAPVAGTGTGPTWSMSGIPFSIGYNSIQVMGLAYTSGTMAGETTVNYPYGVNYATTAVNNTTPLIGITSPTIVNSAYTVSTGAGSLAMSGTASESGGAVTAVYWATDLGYSGTAGGTPASWSISSIPLVAGQNIVTVWAQDSNANTTSVSVNVTYTGTTPANQAPVVSAYQIATTNYRANLKNAYPSYQAVVWPANSVNLLGSVSDDGLPTGSSVSVSWSKVSGPGSVTFSNSTSVGTAATFGSVGTYVLQLTATDGTLSDSGQVVVAVLPSGTVQAAVDCGSTSSHTGNDGIVYAADPGTSTGTNITLPGSPQIFDPNGTGPFYYMNAADFTVMTTERLASSTSGLTYTFSGLATGLYDVHLKFIEPGPTLMPGSRVFNISAQGSLVESNVDIAQRLAGIYTPSNTPAPYDDVLPGVSVTGAGTLTVTLSNVAGYPLVSAIVVRTAATPTQTAITSGALPGTGTIGSNYNYTFTTTGYPMPTFTVTSGSLPPGMSIVTTSGTTAAVVGTPTTSGTYSGIITVSNGVGTPVTKSFTIVVRLPDVLFNCQSQGTPPGGNWNTIASYSAGSVPNAKNFGTGASTGISANVTSTFTFGQGYGTPSSALYPLVVQTQSFAVNAATGTGVITLGGLIPSSNYDITLFGSNTGGSGAANFTIGTTTIAYAQGNNTNQTITFSGVVPNGSNQIVISAAPGTSNIASLSVISVTSNSGGGGGTAPTITNSPTNTATAGVGYSFTFSATGSPNPTFSITSGALPPGLSLTGTLNATISGTPTSTDSGPYAAVATATNGVSPAATSGFSISVNHVPAITGTAPGGVVGTAYSFTYTATGYPTPTCTVTSGSLPAGLSLSAGGAITGTPSTAGTSTGVITANNGVSPSATTNFSIVITQAPSISGTAPGGTTGTAYTYSYTVGGSPAPTCTVTSGSLPSGLSLSAAGVISGTPSAAGTSTGVITANNGVSPSATKNFTIVIVSPLNVYFNFEPNGTSTAPGGNWNTVYGATGGNTSGTSTTSKDFNTGASTGVTVGLSGFTFASWYGKVSTALYPSPVQTYSFATGSGITGTVLISGLDSAKTYSVTVFGSDTGGNGPTFHSTYTIGTTALNYVNTNNTTATAVFSSVTPNGSGQITMTVNRATDHIGSLGALLIHQN